MAVASMIALAVLAVPSAAGASPWNGTPGYFTGNGTPNNSFGGTPLDVNAGGTLQYANDAYAASPYGQSFLLDGATRLRDKDTTVGELGTGDFAIGVHFKTSTFAPNIGLISKESNANCTSPKSGQYWEIDQANNGVYVEMHGPTTQVDFSGAASSAGLIDGAWHFAELIRSGDVLYLYIDGQQVATHAYTGANPSNASDNLARLRLGSTPCSGSAALTGELADAYVGSGSPYTLSVDNTDPSVPAGSSGGPTLSYHKDGVLGTMHTDVTPPTGTSLSGLSGPGCVTATASCQFPLTGSGAGITADVAVPAAAAPGTTFSGGNFSMGDLVVPVSPASTGWNPDNDTANVAFSVTAAPSVSTPLVNPEVAAGTLGGLVAACAALVVIRRRRSTHAS